MQVLKLTCQQKAEQLKLLRCFIWDFIHFIFWALILSFKKELCLGITVSIKTANDTLDGNIAKWSFTGHTKLNFIEMLLKCYLLLNNGVF